MGVKGNKTLSHWLRIPADCLLGPTLSHTHTHGKEIKRDLVVRKNSFFPLPIYLGWGLGM